mmetsp:Transcript_57850/g.123023  ORF Transcript_57850/g.123023 Transcript_57850/m.123023 type:complete len:85 (+) Transcript_57850:365-619(+)
MASSWAAIGKRPPQHQSRKRPSSPVVISSAKGPPKAGAEGEEEAGIERKVVAGTKTGDERIEAAAADVEGVEVDERGKAPGECL